MNTGLTTPSPLASPRHNHGEHTLGHQGKEAFTDAAPSTLHCTSSLTLSQTLIIPALIALICYLVLTFVAIPFWQRYRSRYSQYLPLETISNQTSSVRQRVQNAIGRFLVPSAWRQRLQDRLVVGAEHGSDGDYDSDDGEELGDIDEEDESRLGSMDSSMGPDTTRRLSRE